MGSAAKSNSRRCFTFVNVTTPTAPRTPLPTKFAVAEKHMGRFLRCEDYTYHRATHNFSHDAAIRTNAECLCLANADFVFASFSYAAFFLAAHRAFIIAESFFRMAGLIGLRPAALPPVVVAFFAPACLFCFAHRARCAAAILARAAALMCLCPLAGLAWLVFGGRPRRAGGELSPTRAAIARSIRLASCLSCATTL